MNRKVKFILQDYPESMKYDGSKEVEEVAKKRTGMFHGWGFDIIKTELDAELQVSRGIVEDLETNKVHLVYPEYITFED